MTDDGASDGLWDRLDGFLAADEASRAVGELAHSTQTRSPLAPARSG